MVPQGRQGQSGWARGVGGGGEEGDRHGGGGEEGDRHGCGCRRPPTSVVPDCEVGIRAHRTLKGDLATVANFVSV